MIFDSCIQTSRSLGVLHTKNAPGGGGGKQNGQGLAPGRGQGRVGCVADNLATKAVGKDQPLFGGQDICRKVGRHGEIKPVCPVQIVMPFCVGLEVRQAGLDLDNGDLALRVQGGNINASTGFQRQFRQGLETMMVQKPHGPALHGGGNWALSAIIGQPVVR